MVKEIFFDPLLMVNALAEKAVQSWVAVGEGEAVGVRVGVGVLVGVRVAVAVLVGEGEGPSVGV
jgi:hypothetical protein